MKVEIKKLAEDVATLLGETLTLECETEESPFPGFLPRVGGMVERVLGNLLREAPAVMITGWKPLEGEVVVDADGIGILELPEDFLLLGSVRVKGWNRLKMETGVGPHGKPAVYLHRCSPGAVLQEGCYLAVPKIEEESIEVPPALYPELIKRIADEIN